jgi:hypothetical protein
MSDELKIFKSSVFPSFAAVTLNPQAFKSFICCKSRLRNKPGFNWEKSQTTRGQGVAVGSIEGACETEGERLGVPDGATDSDGMSLGDLDGAVEKVGVLLGVLLGSVEIEGSPLGVSDGASDIDGMLLGEGDGAAENVGLELGRSTKYSILVIPPDP